MLLSTMETFDICKKYTHSIYISKLYKTIEKLNGITGQLVDILSKKVNIIR